MKRFISTSLWIMLMVSFVSLTTSFKYSTKDEQRQQRILELEQNLEKVDAAIKLVQQQIEEARDAPYVPDLYLKMAELHVERSRYLFFKKREENPGQQVKLSFAPEVVDSKEKALEIYQGILKDYPRFRDNDKIHFFMAHEYREMGRKNEMLREYRSIIKGYRKSKYIGEAYLLLGNYYFDNRNLRLARDNYLSVLRQPESKVHNLARYKLAWAYVNEDDNKKALKYFTDIARAGEKSGATDEGEAGSRKLNIIREALVDSVLTYTEVKKPKDAIAFYKVLADDEGTYIKVLSKLANRYYIKKQLKDAAMLYRETLKINPNLEDSREQLARLYEYTRKSSNIDNAVGDIELLVSHMSRYFHSWRVDEKDRLEAYTLFERSARDIATKLQERARSSKKLALYQDSATAYKQYLSIFGDSKFSKEIQVNYAEALYESGDFVEAGKEYEKAVGKVAEADQREVLNSAIFAYFEALKDPEKLTRVEVIDARRGFISSATVFVEKYPKAKETPNLMFSIARSYYDLADYDDAIKGFAAFIDRYPNHPKMVEAGNLALDSYHFKKDYDGLAKFGKGLIAKKSIRNRKFKADVAEIVKQSEFKAIEKVALSSGPKVKSGESAEKFIQFARQYEKSELGEKALYNAFVTAKKEFNPNLIVRSGEELITQFPKSAYLKDVYPTLGNLSLQTGEFDSAALYFEAYAEKFPAKQESNNLLYNAATVRRLLTDYGQAIEDFERVLKSGKRADASEIRWLLALTYEEAGDWDSVARILSSLIAAGRNSVEANYKLGRAYEESGNGAKAVAQYRKAMRVYTKLRPASRRSSEKAAAAGARFKLMERTYQAYENLGVRAGVPEEKVVADKTQRLGGIEKEVEAVANFGSPKWTIAAFYLLGNAYNHFAEFLGSTSVPTGLNAAQKQQYKSLLGKQVNQFQNQARQTFSAAVKQAHKADIFDDYVKSCMQRRLVESSPPNRSRARISSQANTRREKIRTFLLKNPRNTKSLNELGGIYLAAGDYHVARLIFLRAVEVGSREAATYNGLGVSLYHLNQHQDAYFQFKKAWSIGNYKPAGWNLAALYDEYGSKGKAKGMLKQTGKPGSSAITNPNVIPGVRTL